MPIKPGDRLPALKVLQATPEGPREVDLTELLGRGTVVLFGVPGAFTPTCSARHVPSFLDQAEALRAKGVSVVACMAVNDAFVLQAWARDLGVDERIVMLADGAAALARALGLDVDLSSRGLGVRVQRFALIARDGVVTHVGVEEPGGFAVSGAEAVLAQL